MSPKEKLMMQVMAVFREKGQKALELAKRTVLQEEVEFQPLRDALRYFMTEWQDFLHPALLSLACEAVGGRSDEATGVGAAIVLLAAGADAHDDIIDESTVKGDYPTVYGKFGKDIAILAGDILLFKGMQLLHESCEKLPQNKKQMILEIIKQAFLEISSAEAEEASHRGNLELTGQEYLKIIKKKVAAGEASMKIGAILGSGTTEQTELLGEYGRTFGLLMTIRDEFVDMFEMDELKNRVDKECLPLPILFAFTDSSRKTAILRSLKEEITEETVERILDLTLTSKEIRDLKNMLKQMARTEVQRISTFRKHKELFILSLKATLEDL
ncbi:MAG: polyprenyl synthetase family protein [Candidatus Bathyarchaeia archaeon]